MVNSKSRREVRAAVTGRTPEQESDIRRSLGRSAAAQEEMEQFAYEEVLFHEGCGGILQKIHNKYRCTKCLIEPE